ncbi:MAG TPA: SRPBCC family protein [Microbacteriaceae bacterium]
MSESTKPIFPGVSLDPVQRLRALAAGVRGAAVTERVIDASAETVWAILSDLEDGFGTVQPDMRHVHITRRDGENIEAIARSAYGMRARLRGTIRPGWCWPQSRFLIIGVAVTPEGAGAQCRVAMTGGIRIPGHAALIPIGVRREARKSLDRLATIAI